MDLVAVAAVDDALAIGLDGELPWPSIPADKRQYRERVADAPVILGRRTFETMRDDLPGRVQIVLTTSVDAYPETTVSVARDADAAVALAREHAEDVAYVLGGAGVYESLVPRCDRLLLSRVAGEHEADAYFPRLSRDEWRLVRREPREGFVLEEWVREVEGS